MRLCRSLPASALAACAAVLLLGATDSPPTPRELADEYCRQTNAAWCVDENGNAVPLSLGPDNKRRSFAPELHPRFTEEGIRNLRENGAYHDPNDVEPTPAPAPAAEGSGSATPQPVSFQGTQSTRSAQSTARAGATPVPSTSRQVSGNCGYPIGWYAGDVYVDHSHPGTGCIADWYYRSGHEHRLADGSTRPHSH